VDGPMDDEVRVVARMRVEEAARTLGIKEESVRKRIRRGKMRSEKDEDGRLYVYMDRTELVRGEEYTDESEDWSVAEPSDSAGGLIAAKDETIRILQKQLAEEREARRRADTIIAQITRANAALAARVPELGAAPAELPGGDEAAAAPAHGARAAPERSSWWRRLLGEE
jgi:excisionase family DNA binding protein